MAIGLLLVLPRIPQILYGTEILMDDSDNPGDHGLIRTDFPGGWDDDMVNALTGKNLNSKQLDMHNYLKSLLNFRKNSEAIHSGNTMHYAPIDGIYLLSRKKGDETVLYIVNKNDRKIELNTDRFSELNIKNITFKDIYSKNKYVWGDVISLEKNSSIILSNK